MTRVKICGITNLRDGLAAVNAGADALGFIFAPSPRRIAPHDARAIIEGLPLMVTTVGVFVDAPVDEIERVSTEAGVGVVQLHGAESPEDCSRCSRPVIKRFAVSNDDTAADLSARVDGFRVGAYLLDPGGGSGETFRWELARAVAGPVLVAGGLNAENVRMAIREVQPFGVDVSSGVEDRPGVKNVEKLQAFIRAVREQDLAG